MLRLDTVEQLRRHTGDHPVVRAFAHPGPVRGYAHGDAVVWIGRRPGHGTQAVGHGGPADVAGLLDRLADDGELAAVSRLNLPRAAAALVRRVPTTDDGDWDLRWSHTPSPPVPGTDRVVALPAARADEIEDVLNRALPATSTRPGDAGARAWWGIVADGRVVACAADCSRPGALGMIAAVAVRPDMQHRGLGSALTAALTTRLRAEFGTVGLGVMADNAGAGRMYARLGFAQVAPRRSATAQAHAEPPAGSPCLPGR